MEAGGEKGSQLSVKACLSSLALAVKGLVSPMVRVFSSSKKQNLLFAPGRTLKVHWEINIFFSE